MRNLKNVHLGDKDTPGDFVTAISWDASDNGSIIYATGPTPSRPVIELKRHTNGVPVTITSWDAPTPLPELACDNIVLLQHFSDTTTSCLVLAGGDVIVVREDPEPGQEKIEIVGSVDAGIAAAAWAPDEELLAIVSQADTLILMSRDFEPITDVTLKEEDLKVSKHVSVGWGKKETQFQGKRAKSLRDPTMPESVDEGKLSPFDNGMTTVSWRGDGALVAINNIVSGRRAIRVFTRDAVLDSASEPVDGLESALSWRPSGNLIAGVQRLHDHIDVVFFERNGLRHGQFSLRLSQTDMASWASAIHLSWNIDSTVLAVVFTDRVQLWTMGNYHYYLKQEIFAGSLLRAPSSLAFMWHPEQSLRCSLLAKGYILDMDFRLSVTLGSTIRPHDDGIVAVIDGRTLKLTPFKFAAVPPPMAFCEVSVKSNILDSSISASGKQVAVLTTDSLDLYSWDSVRIPHLVLQKTTPISVTQDIGYQHYRESILPGGRPWTETFKFDDIEISEDLNSGRFSMTKKGELLVDERPLARNCTSFLLTEKHLLLTTSQHLLKFVDLTTLEVPGDTPEVDERCRTIERGAKLVTVVPSTYAVVLQMPRGNLETIYPRALVLAGIRQHIDERSYREAYLACRTHQVDMNILHDYKPEAFMANIPLFIEQVKKVSRIDDFLSKLRDDDVEASRSLKFEVLPEESAAMARPSSLPEASSVVKSRKVNRICDAFLSALESKASTNLQNIVTALICKRPPDFNQALQLVADLRRKDIDQADAAVEHLCFLADTNRLYDAALSLYDLEVTLLVAQHSQRDPREYMPFLQSLHALPPLRRRFQIDDHLHHYAKALSSLHALLSYDEVEAYTVKHKLFTTALALYKYDIPHQAAITALYAAHLHSQSRHADAAMAYESIEDHSSAYPLYALAHRWRESLMCAQSAGLPPDQLHSLARSLSTACTETRDYRSAAVMFVDYLSDIQEAARLLCKGSLFQDASYLLTLHNRKELVPEIVDSGLREKSGEISEVLADCKAQLNAQVPRIQELRVKKAEDPLAFFGGDAISGTGGDVPDNVSVAPTDASTAGGQSLFTRYSNASRVTSKTRRREERKRARGKKGSVYEEEYLVNSVKRLVEKVNDLQIEAGRVIEGLLRRGLSMRQLAEALDESVKEMVEMCQKARSDVWDILDSKVTESVEDRPSGADGVFWESQQSPAERTPPEIRLWDTIGLLKKGRS
jgi:elongator complex protein 1